ncbi:hypothetical protein WR25_21571 [Diploscapter pachys]|uniref:26S proteasome regulatory subunit Rpn6 N-terminal domain-containing protein n=1 Tax=Diploscapter pachys TaxID=2018661 RepID=A0A2A2KQM5_9BILA|nr:hypothetical protein WR25_21571 [Diploscapter pachys]
MAQPVSPALAADPFKAISDAIVSHKKNNSEEETKRVEELILDMAKQLAQQKNVASLQALLVASRLFCESVPRAKAGKIVRALVEQCLSIDQGKEEKIVLVQECVDWASNNKQEYLRRTLQARLTRLFNDLHEPVKAQKSAAALIHELRKLEDKELLIEVSVEESKSSFLLKNYTKAKASLLIAKTNANAAYVYAPLQAALDMQSGILSMYCDKDFHTAFSYFFEVIK